MTDEIFEVEERPRERSMRDLYYVFFRHKLKMFLFFCAVVAVVAVGTYYSAEIYLSEAELMVRLGRETVSLDPTATTGQVITTIGMTREGEINTELEIIRSREIAEKVVDSIGQEAFMPAVEAPRKQSLLEQWGLSKPISNRDAVMLSVMKNLNVEVQKDSWIIRVSYEAKSPKLAQTVLSKVVECYLEKHINVHRTPGSYQFFVRQSDHLRSNLANAENELRGLKNSTGIFSQEEQQKIMLGRVGTLQAEIDSRESELASSKAKVEELQKKIANTPELVVTEATVGFSNAAADAMRARLYELQLTEQDLVSKFEPESRQVQDVRKQIAAAQALLDKENQARSTLTKGLNTTYQDLQSSLLAEQANFSSLQARVDTLKKRLADAQAQLKTLNDNGLKITVLTREIGIQEANYRKYSDHLEEARIDDALETGKISNINVVQAATLPIKPIRPKKVLNLLLGFLVGIFGGIACAFFSEYLDHSIKTPDEVEERLRLPTIACIPRTRTRASRISRAAQWDIPVKVREHYEAFKERLLLGTGGSKKAPRVLAITSSHHDEGVSTIAANLATSLARPGDGQVLLIDADLRHPSVHQIFESKLSPGLADILSDGQGSQGAIVPSPVQNLHILSAGVANANLLEIFESDGFTNLLNSIKKDYRFVVIDLPAVNEASWAVRLARLCDGVGLVVEAERSRWEVVRKTKELLVNSNAKVIGVVINKRRFYIPRWLYRTL